MTNLPISIAAATAVAAIAVYAMPANAATQTTQQACSAQYQAAKTAGTLNGQKWPAFYSDCAANLKAGGGATAATAAATKTPVAARASAKAPAGGQSTQQLCSAQYQAAKTAGTLNGQKWPAFLSACSDSIKNYADQAQATPPEPQPTAAPISAPRKGKLAAVPAKSSSGQSAGEIAFQQRIHQCANEWQSEKSAGTLPAGSKWPQFWSQCNAQLKAQM